MLALILSPRKDLSVLGSMGESENEICLTGEMFSAVWQMIPIFSIIGKTLKDQQLIYGLMCIIILG